MEFWTFIIIIYIYFVFLYVSFIYFLEFVNE